MTDEVFFEAQEELALEIGREPTYEETMDYLREKQFGTAEEK